MPFGAGFNGAHLSVDVEKALSDAFTQLPDDDLLLIAQLGNLRPLVHAFFEGVLVMADEPELRSARLGLLGAIRDRLSAVADFTRIQDRK